MKVVSNTSPIAYLVLIQRIDLLSSLFGEVLIPEGVRGELMDSGAPEPVRHWISDPPSWLRVVALEVPAEPALTRLHAGEREAIMLAQHLSADLVVLDEKAARHAAQQRGLRVTGLLGVLGTAADRGLADLPSAIKDLRQTNFRASPKVLKALLERYHR